MFKIVEKSKKSGMEELIEFLLYRPQAAKFVNSIFNSYKDNKIKLKDLDLEDDPILTRICIILNNELVVKEKRLRKIMNLTKQEIRSRLQYLIKKYPSRFTIDYFDQNCCIIHITKEGLIHA